MGPVNAAYERGYAKVYRKVGYLPWVIKRKQRGYRGDYTRVEVALQSEESVHSQRIVSLRYRENGRPGRRKRIERNQRVSWRERWGRRARGGTGRRETTEGRRTVEQARKQEIGGHRVRWVS